MENRIDEIHGYFSDLVNGVKPNGKFQLARIYGAYEREMEEAEKNKAIDEKITSHHKPYHIHRISDDMAIIEYNADIFKDGKTEWYAPVYRDNISIHVYDNLKKALVGLVAMSAYSENATEYIIKMLEL